jgi:hypothetical protein
MEVCYAESAPLKNKQAKQFAEKIRKTTKSKNPYYYAPLEEFIEFCNN